MYGYKHVILCGGDIYNDISTLDNEIVVSGGIVQPTVGSFAVAAI